MWYVLWTVSGNEEAVRKELVLKLPPDSYQKIIIPQKKVQKKYHNEWREVTVRLYPGYLFLVTEDPDGIAQKLHYMDYFSKLLTVDFQIVPITDEEEQCLKKLIGKNEIVDMSYGIIENDKVVVTSGPLVGMEGSIRKIDRHKRSAYIEFDFFQRKVNISVGLEIVRKI